MIAWLRAQWYRLVGDPDTYPPEAAEAPDPVDPAHEDTVPILRAEPFTGDNVTVPPSPAIVAGDDITTYQASREIEDIVRNAHAGYTLYRANGLLRFGGAPELGPGARWSKRGGWKPGRRVR